jgi:hypothetical protein
MEGSLPDLWAPGTLNETSMRPPGLDSCRGMP